MPELPEVEITVRDLSKTIVGTTIQNVWCDNKKMVKRPRSFDDFAKKIKGKEIKAIRRRGKNILFDLSSNLTLLCHQKLTGHFLLGKWEKQNQNWKAPPGPLAEKVNGYIHLLFTLGDGRMLALSDLRKFAKAELWETEKLAESEEIKSLGPEPLAKDFTFQKFKESFERRRANIKELLMNQEVIAGIGNIYSDEILWEAKINPLKRIEKLSEEELKRIYQAMKKILPKAIKAHGESISDFRRISGKRGNFDQLRKVYRREGEKCSRCGTIIKRKKVAGRSAHFCPKCQKAKGRK